MLYLFISNNDKRKEIERLENKLQQKNVIHDIQTDSKTDIISDIKKEIEYEHKTYLTKLRENRFISGEIIFEDNVKVVGLAYRSTKEVDEFITALFDKHYLNDTELTDAIDYGEIGLPVYVACSDVKLIREIDNPVDQNAIKVIILDCFVGYLQKGLARRLNKYIYYDVNIIDALAEITFESGKIKKKKQGYHFTGKTTIRLDLRITRK